MREKNADLIEEIIRTIDNYHEENGISPSVREIAAVLNIDHSTVVRYMNYMKDNGLLEYSGVRNIQTPNMKKKKDTSVMVPLVGRIACGAETLADENIEEYIPVPASVAGNGQYFFLRASGDSMKDAGIASGDFVLVRRQQNARKGQIVVALINGSETTLKRYFPAEGCGTVILHPENKDFDDIVVDLRKTELEIQGVAVSSTRFL